MFISYLTQALRGFWKNRIYSAIHVLGLALAMAFCLLIYLYVRQEYTFDRFHTVKAALANPVKSLRSE